MNNQEAISLMLQRLGNRRNLDRTLVVQELNAKVDELEHGTFMPWFLEANYEVSLLAGEISVALPDDFLLEIEDGRVELRDPDNAASFPSKQPFEELSHIQPRVDMPRAYSLWGGRLYFSHLADTEYRVIVPYYAETPAIADTGDDITGWLLNAFNFTTYATMTDLAANILQDEKAASKFNSLASSSYARLYKYNESRQHINADYNVGGDK